MTFSVRTVEYFYTRVEEEPSRAYNFLARLASEEINLRGFNAVPFGPNHVELTIFRIGVMSSSVLQKNWIGH
jgi:hypothetical protein